MNRFYKKTQVPISAQKLYEWHASGGAFERLKPPWDNVRVVSWQGGEKTSHLTSQEQFGDISMGAQVCISLKQSFVKMQWTAQHVAHKEGEFFVDRQISGPFSFWEHHHRFIPIDNHSSFLEDEIHYKMPLHPIGNIGLPFMRRKLESMFAYRHEITKRDVISYNRYNDHSKSLRIAITGASGLIGRKLVAFLRGAGHNIFPMNRRKKGEKNEIIWSSDGFDASPLEGMDAVIHLAGESIASRWTKKKKKRILESRVHGTRTVAEAISQLKNPPKTFISTSAIGFYGNREEEELDENSKKGQGFLSDVCEQWELSAQKARDAGIRVVHPRIGIVISGQGGALGPMILPFSCGLGGPMGSGDQFMSWVSIDDILDLFLWVLHDTTIEGVVNFTSPNPVNNTEFARQLGKAVHRPAFLPAPAFALTMLLGEMAQGLILDGAKVVPRKALDKGFVWRYDELKDVFYHELGIH